MMFNRQFTIRKKIGFGYLLVLVCLGISIAVVGSRISALQEEMNFIVEHDLQVHELTSELLQGLLDMETGQRGYVITENEKYLDPYYDAQASIEDIYNELYTLIKDNPQQQQNLKALNSKISEWIDTAGAPVIELVKKKEERKIGAFFSKDIGKQAMDEIRDSLSYFQDKEYTLTTERTDKIERNNNILTKLLYAFWMLAAVCALAAAVFVSRSISNTIKQVTGSIKGMIQNTGGLNERIPVRTSDEVGTLAAATNQLLDSIQLTDTIKTEMSSLVRLAQETTDVEVFSRQFIKSVSILVNAQYGAVYLEDLFNKSSWYTRMGIYAGDTQQPESISSFALGEGLLGQCASDQQIMKLKKLPESYITISSGLGRARAEEIALVPVLFEERTIAVLEFASLSEFGRRDYQLLEEIRTTFGTSIQSIAGRAEIEALYNDSQVLAEELQVQTVELTNQAEALQMINSKLEHQKALAESKTEELEEAKEELERYAEQLRVSSQYKSEFLANMSHELRTPLNSILILSEFLADNDNQNLSEEEIQYAAIIHTSGEDLLALINDILDLSKVEAGKLMIKNDYVNLTAFPEKMLQSFNPVAEQKGIRFTVEKDSRVPDIFYSDDKRMEQIIKNLLSNAFKFTERGEVRLSIRMAGPEEIDEHLPDCLGEAVAFSISDTGIGIGKEKEKNIFEAFQQGDGATFRKYGGTGLGLSISKELAALLGGAITVTSKERVGSEFTLYLPSMEDSFIDDEGSAVLEPAGLIEHELQEMEAASSAEEQEAEVLQGKTVMLVDDDERNIFSLAKVLEKQGMKVRTAVHGGDCLKQLEEDSETDLILMDIMMPEMDGYEAIQQIRSRDAFSDIPIIAVTARAMRHEREKCLAAGADDYLSKPIQIEQLISVLRVWLV